MNTEAQLRIPASILRLRRQFSVAQYVFFNALHSRSDTVYTSWYGPTDHPITAEPDVGICADSNGGTLLPLLSCHSPPCRSDVALGGHRTEHDVTTPSARVIFSKLACFCFWLLCVVSCGVSLPRSSVSQFVPAVTSIVLSFGSK